MREVVWTDPEGRKWRSLIPDDAPDGHAEYGILFCPIDLSPLRLPPDIEVRLHNQLFERRIASREDAVARPSDIASAIRTALKISVQQVQDLWLDSE